MRSGNLVLAALLASGCAHARPEGSARSAKIGVPFFESRDRQCGPTALASVLSFWGLDADPKGLRAEIFDDRLDGSLAIDLIWAARRRGFSAEMYSGGLEDLRRRLLEGRPLILLLNVGLRAAPAGHFVVVSGFDDARGGVWAHTETEADAFQTYRALEKHWAKTGHWTLRIAPYEKTPTAGR